MTRYLTTELLDLVKKLDRAKRAALLSGHLETAACLRTAQAAVLDAKEEMK